MKLLLLILGVSLVRAEVPHIFNYHEAFGVGHASRIKAIEEASDFDGGRIHGGTPAKLGQYPYMGGLLISLTTGQTSVCGSTLITNTRLITAAHCWHDGHNQARFFTVVLGSVQLFTGGTRLVTNQVLPHPEFHIWTAHNDVAVVSIAPVSFNAYINRIGLATGSNLFENYSAWIPGFGRTGDNIQITPNQVLSHVHQRVISNDECRCTFGPSVVDSTLCTSGVGGSPCSGDDGGPLVHNNQLIGIFSFGSFFGCTVNRPAAFARITSFTPWINAHL